MHTLLSEEYGSGTNLQPTQKIPFPNCSLVYLYILVLIVIYSNLGMRFSSDHAPISTGRSGTVIGTL